jgi:tetratricopeptide (TPR) repeat protein
VKKQLLIVVFVIASVSLIAQNQALDSIEKVIENYKVPDTTYVKLRLDFIREKIFFTPNDTVWLPYCTKTLEIAQELHYKRGIALAYERLGVYYQSIATNHYKALEYFQKAILVAESNEQLKKLTPAFYGNIGIIYYEQQEYKKAINTYRLLLKHKPYQTNCYFNMANAFTELKEQDSALVYFNKTIDNAKAEKNNVVLALAQSNLSFLQTQMGQPAEALKNSESSLDLVNANRYEFLRSAVYVNASTAYLVNNNFEKAEYYATEALKDSGLKTNTYMQKSIWGTLADIYEEKGDFPEALKAHKKYIALSDSLASEDKKLEFAKRDIQFENDKKQALAEAEIERQKLIKRGTIAGSSGLVLAGILGFVMFYRKRKAEALKKEAEFNVKVSDTELKALRAQMNPHFIFNSLNSINDFIQKNDATSASNYLTKFAKIMRQTLENSAHNDIALEDDLKIIELYLQVEAMRLKNKFTYSIKVEEGIDVENTLVPPLILQPFIENSIWHGISKKESNGHIQIDVKKEDDMLVYVVDDDGVGRKMNVPQPLNESKSMGISITKSRIDILNQKKQTNGNILMIDKDKGLRVEVRLPLVLAF